MNARGSFIRTLCFSSDSVGNVISEFYLSFDPSHRGLRFVIIQKTQHHYDVIIQKTKSLPEPDSQISEIITSIKLSCQVPLRFLLMLYA